MSTIEKHFSVGSIVYVILRNSIGVITGEGERSGTYIVDDTIEYYGYDLKRIPTVEDFIDVLTAKSEISFSRTSINNINDTFWHGEQVIKLFAPLADTHYVVLYSELTYGVLCILTPTTLKDKKYIRKKLESALDKEIRNITIDSLKEKSFKINVKFKDGISETLMMVPSRLF